MKISYSWKEAENSWEVILSGEIDIYNAPELKAELLKLIDEKRGNMLIDCQELKYIDSTGLGVLISALRRVKDHEGMITIRNLKPYIQKIFGITGLDKIFTLEA